MRSAREFHVVQTARHLETERLRLQLQPVPLAFFKEHTTVPFKATQSRHLRASPEPTTHPPPRLFSFT